jgi:hypothetical protein
MKMSEASCTPKFINPLCSVNNVDVAEKILFYNCLLNDELSSNKWVCYGPYISHEDAILLKDIDGRTSTINDNLRGKSSSQDIDGVPQHNKSLLIPVTSYLPHRIDIMKNLISYTFPEVSIKNASNAPLPK